MQFTRTNINKTFRNGVVNASNVAVTNVGGGSSSLSGNFLPAVNNGDGSYTVDLSKVLFTGSVISEGEVTAYGSSDGSGSTTCLLYTSPSPRDTERSRMPSSA